jgi:hypothetical protein
MTNLALPYTARFHVFHFSGAAVGANDPIFPPFGNEVSYTIVRV